MFTQTKDHALYLWIHLSPKADVKQCARVAAGLERYVDAVCPPDLKDEDDEIWAGVGFGPSFLSKVGCYLIVDMRLIIPIRRSIKPNQDHRTVLKYNQITNTVMWYMTFVPVYFF